MHVPRWCFSRRSSLACAVPADNFWFSREYQQLSAFPDDLHTTRPPPILAANASAGSVCHWNQLSDDDCLGWDSGFPLYISITCSPCTGLFPTSFPQACDELLHFCAREALPSYLLAAPIAASKVSSGPLVRCSSCASVLSFPSAAHVRSRHIYTRLRGVRLRLGQNRRHTLNTRWRRQ